MPSKRKKTNKHKIIVPQKKTVLKKPETSNQTLWVTILLLFSVFGLCLYPTPRIIRYFLYGDPIARLKCGYSVDGVPVKWGYACWTAFNLVKEKKFGLTVPAWNCELVKVPALNHNMDGGPLKIYNTTFEQGIGSHAPSKVAFDLDGKYSRFSCKVGIDRLTGYDYNHGVLFYVYADGKEIYRSPKLRSDADPFPIECSVQGVKDLVLFADNTEVQDILSNVDWVDIHFEKTSMPQPSPTAAFTK